jgi:hypothetical protein
MSLIELHPEELLDRARAGTLTAAERHDLGAHLRRCPACAAERRWTADAAAAVQREETGSDRARADRLVAAAMAGRRRTTEVKMAANGPRPRRSAMMIALVATGCLLSAAAAATLWPVARRLWGAANEPPPTPGRAPAAPARTQPLPEPTPEPAKTAPRVAKPETPAVLFGELARARRAGRLDEARRVHDLLSARFPGTREERAGRLLVAQLALRRDEPSMALRLYQRYLGAEGDGPLAEEARLGRALALERLGRKADERRAWYELLERHPRSIHAARARTRLQALDANPR